MAMTVFIGPGLRRLSMWKRTSPRLLFLALTCLLVLAMSSAAVRAADVAGVWKAQFDTQIGVQKYTFTFQQDGGQLTGKAVSEIEGQKREVALQIGRASWRER